DTFFNQTATADLTLTRSQNFTLAEGSQFETLIAVPVTLAQSAATRHIHFDVDAHFDRTDQAPAIEDLFLVYLVDPANPSQTLLDRGKTGTALFSLAGDEAEFTPGQVRYDGSGVTIDVSSLAGLTRGLLVFQLLNSDADTSTTVEISGLSNTL